MMESWSGPRAVLSRAMDIILRDSTLNGLQINFKKCNASYLASKTSQFYKQTLRFLVLPLAALISALPSLKRRGKKPTNYYPFCLPIALLRVCALLCRLAHLAHSIPPTAASLEAFARFDDDVLHCSECSLEIELTPQTWNQAQHGLKHGLHSLTTHAQAAYIAYITLIHPSELAMQRLCDTITVFNGKVACCEQLSVECSQDT